MLGKSLKFKANSDGTTATVEEVKVGDAIIGEFTSLLSDDTAYTGLGATLGKAALVYGAMTAVNWKVTGGFHLNPFDAL